uniref:FBA_2 domain-containing protein n=1 Tax=Steinernema glaseri TaxID=37863 RepID=A0A1I8A6R9_9BILA
MQNVSRNFIDLCFIQSPSILASASRLSGTWAQRADHFIRNHSTIHIFIQILPEADKLVMTSNSPHFENRPFLIGSLQISGQQKLSTQHQDDRVFPLTKVCQFAGNLSDSITGESTLILMDISAKDEDALFSLLKAIDKSFTNVVLLNLYGLQKPTKLINTLCLFAYINKLFIRQHDLEEGTRFVKKIALGVEAGCLRMYVEEGKVIDVSSDLMSHWKKSSKKWKTVFIAERWLISRSNNVFLNTAQVEVKKYGSITMEIGKDPYCPYICLKFG